MDSSHNGNCLLSKKEKLLFWYVGYVKLLVLLTFLICVYQTLRPNNKEDLNTFELTGKIICEVPHAGHHSLDLDEDIRIAVLKGDVIGFQFIGDPIIPYEIDKDANQNPFYKKVSGEAPSVGESFKMNMWNQNGTRKYAVCAQVTSSMSSNIVSVIF
jgi:hypothetical protein